MKIFLTENQIELLQKSRTGEIYQVGNDVLKIVPYASKYEYENYLEVKNNPHPNIVTIYDVSFNEKLMIGELRILMENLDEIEWLKNYTVIYEMFTDELIGYSHQTKNYQDFYFNFENDISYSTKRIIDKNPEFKKLFKNVYDGWIHLRKLGIRFLDMTVNNIMQKNGIYKLIDFS